MLAEDDDRGLECRPQSGKGVGSGRPRVEELATKGDGGKEEVLAVRTEDPKDKRG